MLDDFDRPAPSTGASDTGSGSRKITASTNKTWRLIFAVLLTITGAFIGYFGAAALLLAIANDDTVHNKIPDWLASVYTPLLIAGGAVFGFALGGALFRRIEIAGETLRKLPARDKIFLIGGVSVGLFLTAVLSLPIISLVKPAVLAVVVALLVGVAVTYFSTVAALSMKEDFRLYVPPSEDTSIPKEKFKILDTNVIIDGRIADVARAGFVEGPIYIPGFVLDELRHIADSSNDLKRARGRRGLDILNMMEKELPLVVRQYDKLAPPNGEVDARLVALAKTLNASLVTNDWNLNKVAEVEGVTVLNVNELANALKPIVLPGEEMQVQIVKEGKDADQGVGYLDDGTMIVVSGGRRHMGETVDVIVNSLMQTVAGKMIFAHLREDDEEGSDGFGGNGGNGNGPNNGNNGGQGMRPYSGSRTRPPVRRGRE